MYEKWGTLLEQVFNFGSPSRCVFGTPTFESEQD